MMDKIPGSVQIPGMIKVNGDNFVKLSDGWHCMRVHDGYWQKAKVLDGELCKGLDNIHSLAAIPFAEQLNKAFAEKNKKSQN